MRAVTFLRKINNPSSAWLAPIRACAANMRRCWNWPPVVAAVTRVPGLFVVVLLVASPGLARAQSPQSSPPQTTDEVPSEENPTKQVLFGVREEYYNFGGGAWRNVLLLRADKVVLKKNPLGGKTGLILRTDIPFATGHAGNETHSGLGDIYVQALYIPHLTRKFAFATGAGLQIPTATNKILGGGKWNLAPLAVPIWFLPNGRGFFLVKVQNFFSVAGDDKRPNVHKLLITPAVLFRPERRSFLLFDTEASINWKLKRHTGFKSGVQIGRFFWPKVALWVKPEFGWGGNRVLDWSVKFAMVRYK